MASKSLQDILGWVALTKAVNAVKDGVPNPLPPWLFDVAGEDKIVGNSVKFNRTYGTRKTARVTQYGAPPRIRPHQDEELVEAKMIHFMEKRQFDPLVLQTLRDYESYDNAAKAERIVAHNVKTLGTMMGNARVVSVVTTLAYGAIYADDDGNLLPTSSGADVTHSADIDSANIGTVTHADGSTSIFGATGQGSWALNTTNIPKQLRLLKESASMDHGYEPKIALYGKNIPEYLITNDYVLDFMARNPTMQTKWLEEGEIPDGLFGFTWVPAWKASYDKDIEGTVTKTSLWPQNQVTFMPGQEDKGAFWSMFEGSYMVPNSLDITSGFNATLNSFTQVFGAFGYSRASIEPLGISISMGDTFWPAVKLTDVLYLADVTS